MARHDDYYRFRNDASRDDRGSPRDSISGGRAGRRSYDDENEDRSRYGRYEGERGDIYHYAPAGRRGSEYGDGGGSSYGRGNYEQDDMSSGGLAGGARGYGYAQGPGQGGDRYTGRGGSLGGMSGEMGGSHSQGMGRYDRDQGRSGWFGGRPGSSHGSAGRYGSEHAGMGGGYGIGASGQEHHRGKGPKGYTRSDDRIREDVCDCLTDDPMLDAGEIEVEVKDGEVTLSGTVSDRLAKRHAEDMIDRVTGVRDVQNKIKVKDRDTGRFSGKQVSE
ncbi:BON domain-containing protein [Reyranella sp.]|uniref:BON domain-containing protein n=1 Tax=Reyranella sp. TaxID=1929291 RepID=UPI004035A25F